MSLPTAGRILRSTSKAPQAPPARIGLAPRQAKSKNSYCPPPTATPIDEDGFQLIGSRRRSPPQPRTPAPRRPGRTTASQCFGGGSRDGEGGAAGEAGETAMAEQRTSGQEEGPETTEAVEAQIESGIAEMEAALIREREDGERRLAERVIEEAMARAREDSERIRAERNALLEKEAETDRLNAIEGRRVLEEMMAAAPVQEALQEVPIVEGGPDRRARVEDAPDRAGIWSDTETEEVEPSPSAPPKTKSQRRTRPHAKEDRARKRSKKAAKNQSIVRPVQTLANTCLSDDQLLVEFLKLAKMPVLLVPLQSRLVPAFQDAARRAAQKYLDYPSAQAVFEFLALVKGAIVPSELGGHRTLDRLRVWPNVEWQLGEETQVRGGSGESDAAARAEKLVEKGRVGAAAKVLAGVAKVAEVTGEVIEKLRDLHPKGEAAPFGTSAGPVNGEVPKEADIEDALRGFASDVACGVSGWTVPLLRMAAKDDTVLKFLTTLTANIAAAASRPSPSPGPAVSVRSRSVISSIAWQ
ncbi:uncharacterized protein MKK02DRAFT_30856 [Dioszegia hungarica]|uniref:Uncharacterized protein n=1 Tax=Dioszegia hungarica TaxID=4972 RepID=A0AA38H1D0_9TREE|nr:uncharacterized protein MKK02DRAFT_30856 [Dioszegia hungarica]KAI9631865.1 hypothetical protein MKK02DRAFT_30856 [Dioszegia hungarica]